MLPPNGHITLAETSTGSYKPRLAKTFWDMSIYHIGHLGISGDYKLIIYVLFIQKDTYWLKGNSRLDETVAEGLCVIAIE
ncbi:uncharacterized protein BKCO1_2300090 [Diplodia corticola]|uniref:Uncharacterized protein n=1 Tax=Diplodia corticola TaxID=236234 RepID=A0A1J9R176_9PEZI|nr:uncharacterized protein BKCO1_2300090 [Diplodia corticola]OJD34345.1 hypothetical protein BKCO1_2300090 [Diplodia corticola]